MRNFFLAHRRPVLALPVLAVGVAVLLALGVFVAFGVSGRHGRFVEQGAGATLGAAPLAAASAVVGRPMPNTVRSTLPSPAASRSHLGTEAAPGLPVTREPRQYAIAYATVLFSYDTRMQTEAAWAAALTAGLDSSADVRANNTQDLADRTPPAAVWNTMTSSAQHAAFAVNRAWVPQLWARNASRYPAGAVAVTVSGTQHVVWTGGSSEVPQSVTLLLLCPPYNDACVVNRIAAQVLR